MFQDLISTTCIGVFTVEAVFACAAELDCKGVNDWLQRVPADAYPCLSEVATVGAVCT